MKKDVQIVMCEICGKEFDKSKRQNNSIHNLCSNKCKYEFLGNMNRKHNLCNKNELYGIWKSIKQRCTNPNDKSYKNYGGRGITICEEWKNDFQAFYDWSCSNGYCDEKLESGRNKLSIDRIDNNGNYEPSNCRWADDKTQANNKRETITIQERKRICPICKKEFYIKSRTSVGKTCSRKCSAILRSQEKLEKSKDKYKKECPICHKIFEDRSGHFSKRVTCSRECSNLIKSPIWEFNGKKLRVLEWEKETGINAHCLLHRKEMGWSIEKILTTPLIEKGNKKYG